MNKITIIVPCYNASEYLERCLDSLLQQTYPVNILIVNDGSTDSTNEIALSYAKSHLNISILEKKNAGLPQARQSGVNNCCTDYVGFVDADDWCEPDMWEKLLASIEESDADISCCNFFWEFEKAASVNNTGHNFERMMVVEGEEAYEQILLRHNVFPYMWNKLFKRPLLDDVLFPNGNFTGEDFVTLSKIVNKNTRIAINPLPLYHYRVINNSMSRGGFRPAHYDSVNEYKLLETKLSREYPRIKQHIYSYLSVEYMSFIVAMSRNDQYDYKLCKTIHRYVVKHIVSIVTDNISVKYKVSALLCFVNFKLMVKAYWLIMNLLEK